MHARRRWFLIALTLLAFGLRLWRIESSPPGWSDDELSNTLVISQKVLDGRAAWYYNDASGHEPFFHTLVAGTIALFGHTWVGLRLVSMFMGTLAVPLLYVVGRRLFGPTPGLVAAAALAVAYWGLHYSRVNQRHVTLPALLLLAFAFYWLAVRRAEEGRPTTAPFAGAGVALALSYYTYFASRGLPLVLIGFLAYCAVAQRDLFRQVWRGTLVTLGLSLLLVIPMALSIGQQEGGDARVAELAVPLVDARAGEFDTLITHVRRTLAMFHADGDEEFLYNIPGRPIFGPLTAIVFWSGVALATILALAGLIGGGPTQWRRPAPAAAFLAGWWLTGLSPAFISVPPASMSHTIMAQPASYLLLALPFLLWRGRRPAVAVFGALLLVGMVAARDLPDYYNAWPSRGLVRFLYHADMRDVARYAAENDTRDFAVSGLLMGPWAREALNIDLANAGVDDARPRWFNADRAAILALGQQAGAPKSAPVVVFHNFPNPTSSLAPRYNNIGAAGAYTVGIVANGLENSAPRHCFANGLCLVRVARAHEGFDLTWQVAQTLALPPIPIEGKPPAPGAYDGPRLLVFVQLWDNGRQFLAGDDGLWVDPTTLRVGDVFRQRHFPMPDGGAAFLAFGLYDPLTGVRIPTAEGDAVVVVPLEALP